MCLLRASTCTLLRFYWRNSLAKLTPFRIDAQPFDLSDLIYIISLIQRHLLYRFHAYLTLLEVVHFSLGRRRLLLQFHLLYLLHGNLGNEYLRRSLVNATFVIPNL